ncbi:MAG TPA: hypothetical protein VFQ53_15965 [Kofleriaceae bacterium]|nr:hypothetical protein [Kofleriaceae bacterium]
MRFPFKQAVKRAGLPDALRFHDLRHTFASHWVLDGGDTKRKTVKVADAAAGARSGGDCRGNAAAA